MTIDDLSALMMDIQHNSIFVIFRDDSTVTPGHDDAAACWRRGAFTRAIIIFIIVFAAAPLLMPLW